MRWYFVLLILFSIQVTTDAQATRVVRGSSVETIHWDRMVGKPVAVEGLAWGAYDKGLGQHIVLPHGRIYIRGLDFLECDANGRLLAVNGVLRKGRVSKAPTSAQGYATQGYGSSFDYYFIEASSWKPIERVTDPQVVPHSR